MNKINFFTRFLFFILIVFIAGSLFAGTNEQFKLTASDRSTIYNGAQQAAAEYGDKFKVSVAAIPSRWYISDLKFPALNENQKQLVRDFSATGYVRSRGANRLPAKWDWRDNNGVTPVGEQQNSDCWAWGATHTFEHCIKVKDKQEVRLAVQDTISCSGAGTAANGGDFVTDFFISKGCALDADYPYTGQDDQCRNDIKREHKLSDAKVFNLGDAAYPDFKSIIPAIQQMVYEQGAVVTACVSQELGFRAYAGGTYNVPSRVEDKTDHIVLICGWDDNKDGGAFLIKNSYSTQWGEGGYAWIKYGSAQVGFYNCQYKY
ncbi:MAG: C1 family peptidase [Candidatus Wallbacteria bacterium]|nr:C1 family peptidase [Candidatus Wallbacteria bacterium]